MDRALGPEAAKTYQSRSQSGIFEKYLSGDRVLDIGYRGGAPDALPITDKAIGVDLDYPGYDGIRLPFEDNSQDAVFSSHCLEHIEDQETVLADWYRVIKIGGYLVIAVPHQYLYERRAMLPSKFNGDHKRFYTPASLLEVVESALPLDGYRIRSLKDNDEGFDYDIPPNRHARGCYEIELIIEKIKRPSYGARIGWSGIAKISALRFIEIVRLIAQSEDNNQYEDKDILLKMIERESIPPYILIKDYLNDRTKKVVTDLISNRPFDKEWYINNYKDILNHNNKDDNFAFQHYINNGYYEGRLPGKNETLSEYDV